MTEQEKVSKSAAQRQADLRQRRAEEGLSEVRGIYATQKEVVCNAVMEVASKRMKKA